MDSTEIHLDGNNFDLLGPELFLGRSKVISLYLNSSKITGVSNATFLGLSGLKELFLDHNKMPDLTGDVFHGLVELEVLDLSYNSLTWISRDSMLVLKNLHRLFLHNNLLTSLHVDITSQLPFQVVTLHSNRLQCSTACQWVHTWHKLGRPTDACKDISGSSRTLRTVMSACTDADVLPVSAHVSSSPIVAIFISVTVATFLVVIITITLFILRRSITRSIYSSPKSEEPTKYSALSNSLPCHAYLHYCMADDNRVRQHVVPNLLAVAPQAMLCLHHRDLPPRTSVGDAIAQAVLQAKCIIIIASAPYFESSITGYELQIIMACLPVGRNYPIIVLNSEGETINVKQQLRERVGSFCESWSFLDSEEVRAWEKLSDIINIDVARSVDKVKVIHSDSESRKATLLEENIYSTVDDISDQKPFNAKS